MYVNFVTQFHCGFDAEDVFHASRMIAINLVANPILHMYVANRGGGIDPSNISAAVQDKYTFQTATRMLSGFSNLWLNLPELTPECTGSRESKMATDKPKVPKTQLLY